MRNSKRHSSFPHKQKQSSAKAAFIEHRELLFTSLYLLLNTTRSFYSISSRFFIDISRVLLSSTLPHLGEDTLFLTFLTRQHVN